MYEKNPKKVVVLSEHGLTADKRSNLVKLCNKLFNSTGVPDVAWLNGVESLFDGKLSIVMGGVKEFKLKFDGKEFGTLYCKISKVKANELEGNYGRVPADNLLTPVLSYILPNKFEQGQDVLVCDRSKGVSILIDSLNDSKVLTRVNKAGCDAIPKIGTGDLDASFRQVASLGSSLFPTAGGLLESLGKLGLTVIPIQKLKGSLIACDSRVIGCFSDVTLGSTPDTSSHSLVSVVLLDVPASRQLNFELCKDIEAANLRGDKMAADKLAAEAAKVKAAERAQEELDSKMTRVARQAMR